MNDIPASDAPICVAIVICNEVIEDKRTSNKTLINLFNGINVSALPALHPRLCLLASLTNLQTDQPVGFSITGPSGAELMKMEGTVSSGGDPLAVFDLVVEMLALTLAEEGVHSVNILSADTVIGSRRFSVIRQG